MALTVGSRLGHYDVTALIGEGGMGQVYRATDTQLGRDVALKILPDAFVTDPDRLARFQREAQVLASLNHPNIAQIHGIEKSDDTQALVLELVEGPTLADRIAKGPIPLDEALPIAKQIAEALEAAHEAGVIHRDLKPANIKVRDDGTVKVLDFGLAKALDTTPAGDPSQSPTLTAAATQMGVILGTAAYMAPEQAKGKTADRRSDVWAFGAVLYEMLAGRRAFVGDDVSDTIVSVFRDDPDWSALSNEVPSRVRQAIGICLQKDSKQRVRDISAIRLAMEGAFETSSLSALGPSQGASAQSNSSWQAAALVVGASVVVALVTGFAVWNLRPEPERRAVSRFEVLTAPTGPFRIQGARPEIAISPDGTRIVYGSGAGGVSNRHLFLRRLDQIEAIPLRGTQGGDGPVFSPDGQSVGFVADNALKKVSILGGPAVTICDIDGGLRGISWGPDDTIVFSTTASQGLMTVSAAGGEPEVLTSVEEDEGNSAHRWPHVLPNGEGVLFVAGSSSDTARLAVVSLETREVTYLLPGSSPHYSPTGHIVYGVDGTLRAVGFDPNQWALTSEDPVPVVEGVNTRASGAADFSLSMTRSLVYVGGAGGGVGAPQRTLVWMDRDGREEPVGLPAGAYQNARLSPDGRYVAVDSAENGDVWIGELARGTLNRLTTDPAPDGRPLWTPDGARVVFDSNREGARGLFSKAFDGTGAADRLVTIEEAAFINAHGWSPDGKNLVFFYGAGPDIDIGLVSMEEEPAWEPLLQTEAAEGRPAISPDGDWIAYGSNETGRNEVYVQRFPGLGTRRPVSVGGGNEPLWSADGSELFYTNGSTLMVVPVETQPDFVAGTPQALFGGDEFVGNFGMRFEGIDLDGQRFLMIKGSGTTGDDRAAPIILVENWFTELQRLVPVP